MTTQEVITTKIGNKYYCTCPNCNKILRLRDITDSCLYCGQPIKMVVVDNKVGSK